MSGGADTPLIDWLRLARTPGLGPVGIARLMARYNTPAEAIDALPGRARRAGRAIPAIPDADRVSREIEAADRAGVRLLCLSDSDYPAALAAIPDAPPVIAVKGRTELLDAFACGMVGARNASAAGLRLARELAHGLGSAEVCVVSGLARGIDGACHAGALETGTVAVLAGGLDHVYPPEHDRHSPAGTAPSKSAETWSFTGRNGSLKPAGTGPPLNRRNDSLQTRRNVTVMIKNLNSGGVTDLVPFASTVHV